MQSGEFTTKKCFVDGISRGKKPIGADSLVTTTNHPGHRGEFYILTSRFGTGFVHHCAVAADKAGLTAKYGFPAGAQIIEIKIDSRPHLAMKIGKDLNVPWVIFDKPLAAHVRECVEAHRSELPEFTLRPKR